MNIGSCHLLGTQASLSYEQKVGKDRLISIWAQTSHFFLCSRRFSVNSNSSDSSSPHSARHLHPHAGYKRCWLQGLWHLCGLQCEKSQTIFTDRVLKPSA